MKIYSVPCVGPTVAAYQKFFKIPSDVPNPKWLVEQVLAEICEGDPTGFLQLKEITCYSYCIQFNSTS